MSATKQPPFVCIYASQVAMCVGANKHKKISEAMDIVWQRTDPHSFRAALRRNRVKTDDEIAEGIIHTHTQVQHLVNLTLSAPCDSSDQVAKRYDAVSKELRAVSLHEEDRRLVEDVLKRNLYTTYGNVQESGVLQYVRDTLGIGCAEDPTFYKREQGVCEGPWGKLPWFVGGKIDAIDDSRTLLIEIKNRVNRLFYRVPFYEQLQVQTYLELLDLERGVLVECLRHQPSSHSAGGERDHVDTKDTKRDHAAGDGTGEEADRAVNVISITRDRDLWAREIVPKLRGFVDFLARLLNDASLQDRYLQSRRRNAMVTSHVNNWIKFNC